MLITYRPSRLEDLERADALVVTAINDLTERHGFGRMASPSSPRFQSFCIDSDPRGLWTAEDKGEPIGFAWSWVRDEFWFLAQLFVNPGAQANGIGRELLRRTIEHADHAGAKQRALITFAFNTVSQGLYIRHGFAPRLQLGNRFGLPLATFVNAGGLCTRNALRLSLFPEIGCELGDDRQHVQERLTGGS